MGVYWHIYASLGLNELRLNMLNCSKIIKDIFTSCLICCIWLDTSRWNKLWNKSTCCLCHTVHTMPVKALATLRASASAGMVLTPKLKYSVSSIGKVDSLKTDTYASVSKAIIGSDNDLPPVQCQAIIRTNTRLLFIGSLATNVSVIWIKIQQFSYKKMFLKMLLAKWQPFCLCLNVLIQSLILVSPLLLQWCM